MPVRRHLWESLNELRNNNQIHYNEALTEATVVIFQCHLTYN